MREITSRLTQVRGEFEIIAFGDKVRVGGEIRGWQRARSCRDQIT